jgi:hypothetical protein
VTVVGVDYGVAANIPNFDRVVIATRGYLIRIDLHKCINTARMTCQVVD